MSSISSNQQHCYLQQQPHCQFYADAMHTLQHNQQYYQQAQSNYLPCPYASVKINGENGNLIQSLPQNCSTLPADTNALCLKQLCEFTNNSSLPCNQMTAAHFTQATTLAQNLNNLNSLPNLTNLTTGRKLMLDECQYATVKRTGRKPQNRNNIYDYPGN